MKRIAIAVISLLSCYYSPAQSSKLLTVKAGTTINESIPFPEIYVYPAFQFGTVLFKDGQSANAKLNYNFFDEEIKFIDPQGDTLGLANETTIKAISINTDTFYYDKGYLRQILGDPFARLVVHEKMREVGKEQISSYGQATSTAGSSNATAVDNNRSSLSQISPKFNRIYARQNIYYLGDRNNNFIPFTRKNLYKAYSKFEKEMTNYLKNTDIDFNKEEDLKRITQFLRTLKS